MIRLPYAPGNGDWLRSDHRGKPEWVKQYKCWETPKSWFEDAVRRLLRRFGGVYVIQPSRRNVHPHAGMPQASSASARVWGRTMVLEIRPGSGTLCRRPLPCNGVIVNWRAD